MNIGFKVSPPGEDVTTAPLKDLIVDSNYPFLKCDMRKKPKNYGTIYWTIASITTANTNIILYQQPHGYNYVPSFITTWNFITGTSPTQPFINQTFGIGNMDAAQLNTTPQAIYLSMYCDATNFYIVASSGFTPPYTGLAGVIRFYIFADDFSGN